MPFASGSSERSTPLRGGVAPLALANAASASGELQVRITSSAASVFLPPSGTRNPSTPYKKRPWLPGEAMTPKSVWSQPRALRKPTAQSPWM